MSGKKKMLLALMSLLLLCALCLPALAELVENVKYIEYKWDGKKLTSEEKTCTATKLTGWEETLETGWYVAADTLTYNSRLNVSGDVHLILADKCSLTAEKGITVEGDNTLSIYAQSEDEGMGALTASKGTGSNAKIGGTQGKDSGLITIHGGKIEARSDGFGAAIGGGSMYAGHAGTGYVTIHGGIVTARASKDSAGIGGGDGGAGVVQINGGTVTAGNSNYGAGIGGGRQGDGTIEINGGTVTAMAQFGAAIGNGTIEINGGTVTAWAEESGPAIGNGTIEINGGTVTATVRSGAAIGNGYGGSGGSITIGDGMRVLSGGNESEAEAFWKDERVSACGNKWVQVRECLHDGEFRFNDREETHCAYCGERKNYPEFGAGTSADPWRISTAGLWNDVAAAVAGELNTKEKHFLLAENISVTTMIGVEGKPFEGVFDGGGKTLTVNLTASSAGKGPFAYVSGASFAHLRVAGTITTSVHDTGGLVGQAAGGCTITDCVSDVHIVANGGNGHAGFVGLLSGNVAITGSAFTGSIVGANTSYCAGFAGKGGGTADDCVYDGLISGIGNNNTFLRQKDRAENCYYTNLNGIDRVKGRQAHTVTAEPAVPLAFGRKIGSYSVSGITAFETGLSYRGTCLAAEGETVPVTVADMPDVTIDSLTASAGTLAREGGGWKLTMPGEDVVLTAGLRGTFRNPDFRLPASVTSIGAHAFEGAKMTAVEVGGKCGSIGEAAFRNCGSLVKIRIPASVETIDPTAFDGCGTVFVFGAAKSAAQTYCDGRANLVFVEEGKRGE